MNNTDATILLEQNLNTIFVNNNYHLSRLENFIFFYNNDSPSEASYLLVIEKGFSIFNNVFYANFYHYNLSSYQKESEKIKFKIKNNKIIIKEYSINNVKNNMDMLNNLVL